MIQISNFAKLRKQLLSDHILLRELCIKLDILQEKRINGPDRVLGTWESNGFAVTSWVDDDDLSEEEKNLRYADLADQCIKALKSKAMRGDYKK
ncbi:hypothetical protein NE562_07875 [Butyricicoccus faecihominis]|uniref:hypothetical protein n=1 Tax=Butyricicoccus faecihominis TaxID=1712515 RepID=UPI0024791015|nr:hypothetical protein [Butyricicoccus faecihominis]MCQ5129576.1 hypothetical protein [Butyricicoccus faecihominis]